MSMSARVVLEQVGWAGNEGIGPPTQSPTHPSEGSSKSARPVTITTGTPRFITRGRTSHETGVPRLLSPLTKTLLLLHSVHDTLPGAWIAALTSERLKYTGD